MVQLAIENCDCCKVIKPWRNCKTYGVGIKTLARCWSRSCLPFKLEQELHKLLSTFYWFRTSVLQWIWILNWRELPKFSSKCVRLQSNNFHAHWSSTSLEVKQNKCHSWIDCCLLDCRPFLLILPHQSILIRSQRLVLDNPFILWTYLHSSSWNFLQCDIQPLIFIRLFDWYC